MRCPKERQLLLSYGLQSLRKSVSCSRSYDLKVCLSYKDPRPLSMPWSQRYGGYHAQFKQKQRKVNMREMNCKWLRMSNIS